MVLDDCNLLNKIIEFSSSRRDKNIKSSAGYFFNDNILEELRKLKDVKNIYANGKEIRELWKKLIKKSIKWLRYYDRRESFLENEKLTPKVEIDELETFFDHFIKSEGVLYASSGKYRDHVIHAFRTWLIGVYILLTTELTSDEKPMIEKIFLDGVNIKVDTDEERKKIFEEEKKVKEEEGKDNLFLIKINKIELLSMWTLISLCHDIGYPYEKLKEINDNEHTKYFMTSFNFILNVSVSVNFSNTLDKINQDFIAFISSRTEKSKNKDKYFVVSQPKYSNKFYDSLSKCYHGSISANILFCSLQYFKETDYNTGTGYYSGDEKDIVQYYIRREILRSIAIHTCHDIYHIRATTMPFLLIICDELQEWDRKSFNEFYRGKQDIICEVELKAFSEKEVRIHETLHYEDNNEPDYAVLTENYLKQFDYYQKIFRDGMDTRLRDFSFYKEIKIKKTESIYFKMDVIKDSNSTFSICYDHDSPGSKKEYEDKFKNLKNDLQEKYKLTETDNGCSLSYKDDD